MNLYKISRYIPYTFCIVDIEACAPRVESAPVMQPIAGQTAENVSTCSTLYYKCTREGNYSQTVTGNF